MTNFMPWPKIYRHNREVILSEKIDGTNALVHVADDGTVSAGSRTRWITPQADNAGFAKWVEAHAEELRGLTPGYHYGEWYGAGIQRTYGLTEKRFALFNTHRWTDDSVRPACCGVVPVLARGIGADQLAAEAVARLRASGSVAVPGFMRPEGIVIFHTASGNLYKVTLDRDESRKLEAAS